MKEKAIKLLIITILYLAGFFILQWDFRIFFAIMIMILGARLENRWF